MPIIEEYDAIAKRLRELQSASPKVADTAVDLDRWRNLARETARVYVEGRRKREAPRRFRPQPTD